MPNQWTGSTPLAERFWARVVKTDTCWLWTGARGPGYPYGRIARPGEKESMGAHRASWELHYGPIPDGLCVCHRCDNPACVRPDHLFLGTLTDNWDDMRAKGRGSAPPLHIGDAHPMRRYPEKVRRGEANNKARLTVAQVQTIRARHGRGETIRGLARAYGVTKNAVAQIVHYQTWRHVT